MIVIGLIIVALFGILFWFNWRLIKLELSIIVRLSELKKRKILLTENKKRHLKNNDLFDVLEVIRIDNELDIINEKIEILESIIK